MTPPNTPFGQNAQLSLSDEPAPVKSAGDAEPAVCEVSSATDEASGLTQPVARCESGMGSERSRSKMTYRERRAARAERLRGWAEKREQSAGAVLKSHEVYRGDHAFNFQPGHIPERARVIRQDHRAHESLSKAASMRSRADEVERQAEHAVYSDDPDAVERLQERVAKMTADRDRLKAYNASCRKGSPDTSLLTEREQAELLTTARAVPYAMGKGGGFPSYVLTNLSANLNRQKKRLAALERSAA